MWGDVGPARGPYSHFDVRCVDTEAVVHMYVGYFDEWPEYVQTGALRVCLLTPWSMYQITAVGTHITPRACIKSLLYVFISFRL